jgi:hypothetical protein
VTSSRVLSLLAYCASPIFMASAVAGWVLDLWPANPVTLGAAAALVAGGPFLGMLHAATAQAAVRATPAPPAPRPRPVAQPVALVPPRLAAARRFHAWRDATPEHLAKIRRGTCCWRPRA